MREHAHHRQHGRRRASSRSACSSGSNSDWRKISAASTSSLLGRLFPSGKPRLVCCLAFGLVIIVYAMFGNQALPARRFGRGCACHVHRVARQVPPGRSEELTPPGGNGAKYSQGAVSCQFRPAVPKELTSPGGNEMQRVRAVSCQISPGSGGAPALLGGGAPGANSWKKYSVDVCSPSAGVPVLGSISAVTTPDGMANGISGTELNTSLM